MRLVERKRKTVFTAEDRLELVKLGDQVRAAARTRSKKAGAELMARVTPEQRELLRDWLVYRIQGVIKFS